MLCAVCLPASTALAGQLGYGAGTYLSYESNISRVETNAQRELIAAFFGGFSYLENTGDASARIYAYVERRHFTLHTFGDDTRGYLEGTGTWTLLPKRFVWIADDTFQELQVNLTGPATPNNQTKSNSFNTGPELTIPLSSVNSAVLGARYGRFDIQNSNADNQRHLGYARAVHTTPSRSKVSLNFEESQIYFEPGTQFSRALRQDAFARYETQSTSEGFYGGDAVALDLGKSRVNQYSDDVTNTLDGHIVRLQLAKGLTRQFTIYTSYADQISDTYSDLIAGIAASSGSLAPTIGSVYIVQGTGLATADVYRSKRGEVGFVSHGGEIEYTLTAYGRSVDFQTLDQNDYREKGGIFFWRWRFGGAGRFDVFGTVSTRDYANLARTDSDRNYGASVEFKVNRSLTLSGVLGQAQRQSTAPGQSYVDQRVLLLLGFNSNYELRFTR